MKTLCVIFAVVSGLAAVEAYYSGVYPYGSLYDGRYDDYGYDIMGTGMHGRYGVGGMYGMHDGLYSSMGYPYRSFGLMGAYPFGGSAMYHPFHHNKYYGGKKGYY